MKKVISFLMVLFLGFALVACGGNSGGGNKADPTVATAITIKAKVAKVQIGKTLQLSYVLTPATAKANVTWSVSGNLATINENGLLTAGNTEGSIKVTATTDNGLSTSKTIKIQLEEVISYPNLEGYTIKIAQAEHALGEYDVNLSADTKDKYGYYEAEDKAYKQRAWEEMEENYNCNLEIVAYPADAPWGPSRWQYILTQAQRDAPDYDFYVSPTSCIPGYVAGNAVLDITDWYSQYGDNIMAPIALVTSSYKGRLYCFVETEIQITQILAYNYGLWEKINKVDPTIKEPAQAYLDGEWDYDAFIEYCDKVQTVLDGGGFTTETDKYYCLSGYGTYYIVGLINAGGVAVINPSELKCHLTGDVETAAGDTMKEIFALGAMDPTFQVDQGVATWNAGHSLFNTGSFWFVNANDRWTKTLWGSEEDTKYGYVPFPSYPGTPSECTYFGTTAEAGLVMAAGRDWAYEDYGEDCTAENIFRAYVDYVTTAKRYYTTSEGYDHDEALKITATKKFASQASINAYVKVMQGVQDYAVFDPWVNNSNPVIANYGGNFATAINNYIKGTGEAQWIDAVSSYESTINDAIMDAYG